MKRAQKQRALLKSAYNGMGSFPISWQEKSLRCSSGTREYYYYLANINIVIVNFTNSYRVALSRMAERQNLSATKIPPCTPRDKQHRKLNYVKDFEKLRKKQNLIKKS